MQLRTFALIAAALLPFSLSHAAAVFDIPEPAKDAPSATMAQLDQQVQALNKVIGGFPIRVSSDEDRQAVYRQWSATLQQAWGLEARAPRAEATLGLLADLYRQGHNLDVKGSADKANQAIVQCLGGFSGLDPLQLLRFVFLPFRQSEVRAQGRGRARPPAPAVQAPRRSRGGEGPGVRLPL